MNKVLIILIFFVIITSPSFAESEEYIQALQVFKERFREYALIAHEKSREENKELIECIIRESFDYIPGIENFNAMMSYKLRYYLEEHEGKIVFSKFRYLNPENNDIVGFSVIFGNIIDTEDKQIPISNTALADIVGDTMTWRAVYYEQEHMSFDEIRGEDKSSYAYTALNYDNKMTAYINIDPEDVNAHEMMHIWQYERRRDNDGFLFPVYLEFQAMAFDLAYNAYADTDEPLKNIIWAINRPFDDGFYYRAGKYFESFFQKKGYAVENLCEMPHSEREQYGLELLQLYEKHGQDLF